MQCRASTRRQPLPPGCWLWGLTAGCNKAAPPPAAHAGLPVPGAAGVAEQRFPPSGHLRLDHQEAAPPPRRSRRWTAALTRILVKSGDAGKGRATADADPDPLKQVATVESLQGTEQQQKATFQDNQADLARQEQLYMDGILSQQAYDQAVQAYQNAKAGLDSASALTNTQKQQLAYYQIRAPFAGIVGDIPVHQGDYVSSTTVLTTVDENADLEAYIYIPTDRAAEVHNGLAVDLLDESGTVLAKSAIYFVSPEVDNNLQGILAKAPIPKASQRLRDGQIVNARVTWNTAQQPTIPVLAVSRIGGQSFVYVAAAKGGGYSAHLVSVTLGEPVGNVYPVLGGLQTGDRVIVSGIQMLQEGAPVQPLQGGPPPAHAGS